ncbi:MAG: DUF4386 domain-containing protein [Candidatus Methylomirabilaceae bacterium]
MKPITTVRVGGLALVFGAIAFMAVFSFLAARFDYPAILDGPASTVLPRLLATGTSGRVAWALYAFLPLIWLPAGVGAYCALRRFYPGAMLLALQWAVLAAVSMMLGLMRWPSVHWHLAQLQATATPEQQQIIAAIFAGFNTYLGNYIGEFLGELSFNAFFLLSSWTLFRSRAAPTWVGAVGLTVAGAGFVGMFRNVTVAVAPVAAINNYLLPVWMIVFGVVLFRHRLPEAQIAGA